MKVDIGPFPKDDDTERKIKVQIHGYDIWNTDHTIGLVIYPLLQKVKDAKCGIPFVSYKDMPPEIRKAARKRAKVDKHYSYNKDGGHDDEAWQWILDEMIWAFKALADSTEWEIPYCEAGAFNERMANATRLFGIHLRHLWT